jgi:hypothetical protein
VHRLARRGSRSGNVVPVAHCRIAVDQSIKRVSHFLRWLGRGHCPQFGDDLQKISLRHDIGHDGVMAQLRMDSSDLHHIVPPKMRSCWGLWPSQHATGSGVTRSVGSACLFIEAHEGNGEST